MSISVYLHALEIIKCAKKTKKKIEKSKKLFL